MPGTIAVGSKSQEHYVCTEQGGGKRAEARSCSSKVSWDGLSKLTLTKSGVKSSVRQRSGHTAHELVSKHHQRKF